MKKDQNAWVILDQLHRHILDSVLHDFNITHLQEPTIQHLNQVWHRLNPWPDSVEGLTRLKQKFIICSLSNGNISLLTHMAKHARLPWDCILSAENFHCYKPDPAVYKGLVKTFGLAPETVMLSAAHHDDLAAARDCGLLTAYIQRPLEYGMNHIKEVSPQPGNHIHASNMVTLAEQLGC